MLIRISLVLLLFVSLITNGYGEILSIHNLTAEKIKVYVPEVLSIRNASWIEKNIAPNAIKVNNARLNDDQPIKCNVDYSEFWSLSASWSSTITHKDYSTGRFLLDYSLYADSFKDFSRRYPNVTIRTSGRAVSSATFGDAGANKFGRLTYQTELFTANNDVYYVKLVDAYAYKSWAYRASAKIGIGFKSKGTKLYLSPFIDGEIYSAGAYKRNVDIGLAVFELIFNTK